MRAAELVLVVVVLGAAATLGGTLRGSWPWAAVVGGLSVAAALVQVTTVGARWPLAPVYLAAGLVLVVASRGALRARAEERRADGERAPDVPRTRAVAAVVVVLVAVGGAAAWALPVATFRTPTGPLRIGTSVTALTDEARTERYGPSPGGPRELVAQVWYPADADAEVAPSAWIPAGHRFGRVAARWLDLPPATLDHVGLVASSATVDARPADDVNWPVVVYLHGWGGFRTVQSDLLESLASHGYVVVALDHTYGAVATAFPDGRVAGIDPSALPEGSPNAVYDAAAEELVATFADDVRFLLGALEDGAFGMLTGRFDLGNVGLVGHSTGGGAAVRLCGTVAGCGAVVGFDPWVEPVPDAVVGAGLDVPLLSIRSEAWVGDENDARLRRLHAASSDVAELAAITGTTHRDVTALPYLTPLAEPLGLAGPTPVDRTHAIVDELTVRFLDTHLRGDPGADPLLDPPPYDELVLG